MYQNYVRLGVAAGLGAVAGALVVLTATRGNNSDLRKGCVSLLSYGLELKDKVAVSIETARENLEDFTAEARHAAEVRKVEMAEAAEAAEAAAKQAGEHDNAETGVAGAKAAGKKPVKRSRPAEQS